MNWLRPEERSRIEAWLDSGHTPKGKYGAYYRLFMAIALESGLRVTEIVGGTTKAYTRKDGTRVPSKTIKGLTHDQANLETGEWTWVLRLKRSDRARISTFLGPRTARIYRELFSDDVDPDAEVFADGPSGHNCYLFCRRLGDDLGIAKLTPHRMRHTLARDMLRSGSTASDIQKALGHATGSTALRYTEATNEEAIQAMKRVRGDQ